MTPLVATREARPAPAARPLAVRHVAWTPSDELDAREWAAVGRRIGSVGRNIQWLLGDWIAYGNRKFGERYARASKISGYDPQTLMNMVYVATRFAVSRRRENLSWSHHETLAALDPEEQDRWLDQATQHRWSVSDLRTMLRVARKAERAAGEGEEDGAGEGEECSQPMVKCPRCGEEISVD
ncbi:MAG TPA: hypothetical protein VG816_03620 [Solirubrobacterales bacterium]|nr:hypothetical protein [Solirubrobacterales bacterium]